MLEAKALLTNSFSVSLSPVFGLPYVLYLIWQELGVKSQSLRLRPGKSEERANKNSQCSANSRDGRNGSEALVGENSGSLGKTSSPKLVEAWKVSAERKRSTDSGNASEGRGLERTDGSTVKRAYSSCREPEFGSQHRIRRLNTIYSNFRNLTPSSGLMGTHTYMCTYPPTPAHHPVPICI